MLNRGHLPFACSMFLQMVSPCKWLSPHEQSNDKRRCYDTVGEEACQLCRCQGSNSSCVGSVTQGSMALPLLFATCHPLSKLFHHGSNPTTGEVQWHRRWSSVPTHSSVEDQTAHTRDSIKIVPPHGPSLPGAGRTQWFHPRSNPTPGAWRTQKLMKHANTAPDEDRTAPPEWDIHRWYGSAVVICNKPNTVKICFTT